MLPDIRKAVTVSQQRTSLYTVDWQVRRIGFKGRWCGDELAGVLRALEFYINAAQDIKFEHVTRLYRVANCLDAVWMGWQDKLKDTPERNDFLAFKDWVHCALNKRTTQTFAYAAIQWQCDTDAKIKEDWQRTSLPVQDAIVRDLINRFIGSTKRWKEGNKRDRIVKSTQTRPELYVFLWLVAHDKLEAKINE